ncbi:MAG TPA: IclR family transcriptional regulator, partial [Sphingomonadaceae bacterium]|nr:IclR family transcriptional regulator [Sphingomonadaceae bacterium]
SSLSYLLATLVERQYLQREGRRYTAGSGLERLQARNHVFSLADRVAPLVRTVRVQLNETCSFFVREGWEIEAIVTETSEQALRYSIETGQRSPMHALASGKALLAAMPDEELERYFAEVKLERFTPSTITSEAKLRKQIEKIRKTGIATTVEELSLGINGIGRAVSFGGQVVGALSVAIPKVRCDDVLLKRAADLLEKTAGLLESE